MAAGRLHISERKLEAAEHAEARDGEVLVCVRQRELEGVLSRCPRLLDEAEVSLDQPPDSALPTPGCGRTASARRARRAAEAFSSARCQRPAHQSTCDRYQRSSVRVPSSPLAAAVASSSSKIAAARSISPRRISCLPSQTRGLSTNSSSSPKRSSISAPRSSKPGVISAPHVSACPTRAIAAARRAGSPTRSALSSADRASASAAPTLAASRWKRLRRARILAERASSPAACANASLDELARRGVSPECRGQREEDVCPLHTGRNLGQELIEQRGRMFTLAGKAMEVRGLQAPLSRQDRIVRVSARQPARTARRLRQSPRAQLPVRRQSGERRRRGHRDRRRLRA